MHETMHQVGDAAKNATESFNALGGMYGDARANPGRTKKSVGVKDKRAKNKAAKQARKRNR